MTPENVLRLLTGFIMLANCQRTGNLAWFGGLFLMISGVFGIRPLVLLFHWVQKLRRDGDLSFSNLASIGGIKDIDISGISNIFPVSKDHTHEVKPVVVEQNQEPEELSAAASEKIQELGSALKDKFVEQSQEDPEETFTAASPDAPLDVSERRPPGWVPKKSSEFSHDVHSGMKKKKLS